MSSQHTMFETFDRCEMAPPKTRFEQWLDDNPHIYEWMRDEALALLRSGKKRYGIATLFEVYRWHMDKTTNNDDFKINNNYKAPLARLLMSNEPELKDFFSTRESKNHE